MSVPDPTTAKTKFLDTVQRDHGDDLRRSCEEVFEDLSLSTPFNPFYVLAQARLRLQESKLQELAAMNATPFASARNREK